MAYQALEDQREYDTRTARRSKLGSSPCRWKGDACRFGDQGLVSGSLWVPGRQDACGQKRQNNVARTTNPVQVRRLVTLLCIALLVERGEAAEYEDRVPSDYVFMGMCIVAVIAIWECVKSVFSWMAQCCGSTGLSRRGRGANQVGDNRLRSG